MAMKRWGLKWWGLGAGARFFVSLAAASLVPVIALGAAFSLQYRHELRDRGVAQGKLQAALISRLITDTQLTHENLLQGVGIEERTKLDRLADTEVDSNIITRFRLRDPALHIVYSSDGSGVRFGPGTDDGTDLDKQSAADVVTALNGDPVGKYTERAGQTVVEVIAPLRNVRSQDVIGVLQIDLPYGPIAAEINRGLHRLYLGLAAGLILLYLVLGALVWWSTRALARSAAFFEHQALHDALTDLPNRALFADRIDQTAASLRRNGGTAAIVMIDLDGFRQLKESLGPENGDLMLKTVGERLQTMMRGVDTVAGLGGDKFGLILPGVQRQDQLEAATNRARAAIEAEVVIEGVPVSVQASMGVSYMPLHGTRSDVLVQRADVATDVAKRTHGKLVAYDEEQNHYSADRLALISQLRQAVDHGQLVMHYLPKVTLPDGRVQCLEALVRWNHPTRGLLMPDTFVPLAEQTGLIDDLTRGVLHLALSQLKQWRAVRPDLTVAVNISARSLLHVDLPQMVLDALADTGCRPGDLLLEITETALVTDPERSATVMDHLQGLGLRLSLDDFGEGFTSLSQLAELPLSEIKVDRTFVSNMNRTPADSAIVRSVVDLGHNLDLKVVAEGVETTENLQALLELGCDAAQGYLFSPPLPAEQIIGWLAEHSPQQAPPGAVARP